LTNIIRPGKSNTELKSTRIGWRYDQTDSGKYSDAVPPTDGLSVEYPDLASEYPVFNTQPLVRLNVEPKMLRL